MSGALRWSAAGLLVLVAAAVCRGADEGASLRQLEELMLATKYANADELAKKLVVEFPKSAVVHCRVAALHAARGRYDEAAAELKTATELDFKLLEPRALAAELHELLGRHVEAVKAANAVIDYFNEHAKEVTSPREMVAVGLALRLVNEPKDALRVLAQAQRADKADHTATIELGRLFLLKGQVTDASKEFNTVLAARAKHPEAQVGLALCAASIGKLEDAEKFAREALESAPDSAEAHDLLAALAAVDDDYADADAHVAKSLAVNPNEMMAHAIRAGCHLVRGNKAAYEREEEFVRKLNPRCAAFYTRVGDACEHKRRMTLAEQMYRRAIELDPEAYEALAALGQHLFRQARYEEGKKLLEASHKVDGFNVRTYNTLNLLDEMEKYRETAGPVATVRLKGESDGLLGEYVKRYAVRSLEELTAAYDYRPPGPVTIEVLPTQRYFSARCIGLPYIGAIGVCFGNVVALTSPREQMGRVNWRETLRHELTHAVTLLGTDFRIPHWLTEAMAVHEQGGERPHEWDVLLKTSARLGRLIPVRELTKKFTRPKTGEERMLAYCESGVVLDFFIEKSGPKAPRELLRQFRDGKELPEAVRAVTGLAFDEFERQCMAYLGRTALAIPVTVRVTPQDEKAILEAAGKAPESAEAQCNLALLYAGQRKLAEAAKTADDVLRRHPRCAEAHEIRARVLMAQGKPAEAAKAARAAVECDKDYAPAHYLLAEIAVGEKRADDAAAHLREAIRSYPRFPRAYEELAKLYRDRKQEDKAAEVYEALVKHRSDALGACIELGRYYVKGKRWADAARVAEIAIGIGPFFAEPHMIAGQALWELGKEDAAVDEMEAATLSAADSIKRMEEMYRQLVGAGRKQQAEQVQGNLDKARKEVAQNNVRLARAYMKKGKREEAKTAALAALELDPNNEEAQALVAQLKGGHQGPQER